MKILVLEDDSKLYRLFERFTEDLRDSGGKPIQLTFVKSIAEFKEQFGDGRQYAAVVLDDCLATGGKLEYALQSGLLEWVQQQNARIPIACNSVGRNIDFDPIQYAFLKGVPNFRKEFLAFRKFASGLCR